MSPRLRPEITLATIRRRQGKCKCRDGCATARRVSGNVVTCRSRTPKCRDGRPAAPAAAECLHGSLAKRRRDIFLHLPVATFAPRETKCLRVSSARISSRRVARRRQKKAGKSKCRHVVVANRTLKCRRGGRAEKMSSRCAYRRPVATIWRMSRRVILNRPVATFKMSLRVVRTAGFRHALLLLLLLLLLLA